MIHVSFPILLLLMVSCVTTAPKPEVPPTPPSPADPCAMVSESIPLTSSDRGKYLQVMPVTKAVAHESHYIIAGLDPEGLKTQTDRIGPHLQRTCDLLRGKWAKYFPGLSADCREIYGKGGGWNQWTPPEPTRGHGTRPFRSVECEAATGNMYFAKQPDPETRFVFVNPANGRAFVSCFGQEVGPGSSLKAGGLGSEGMYYLRAAHGSVLKLGRAVDQKLPFGPVECAK